MYDVLISILKLFTFFTDDQITWSQIICREVIKSCMLALGTKEKIDKKFIIALIYGKIKSKIQSNFRYIIKSHYT